MARGILGGLAAGAAVSVIGAGLLSIVAMPPQTPSAQAPTPSTQLPVSDAAAPAAPEGSGGAVQVGTTSAAGDAIASPNARPADVSQTEQSAALATDVTAPAARPQTGSAADAVPVPDAPAAESGIAATGDAPVLPSPQSVVPAPPEADTEAQVSTQSATPTPPPTVATEPDSGDAPAESAPEVAATEEDDVVVDGQTAQPQTPATPEAAPEADAAPASPQTAEAPEPKSPEPAPAPEAAPEPEAEAETETAAVAPEPRGDVPSIGKPATSLIDRQGAAPDPSAADGTEATEEGAEETVADDPDAPALTRFAAEFDNTDARPLMSIILMDTGQDLGSGPVGLAALGSFPYPLTFAVEATLPDAADRVAQYRSQGLEVMAMIDLPSGLRASDTEVAVGAALASVPEAVAIMEGPQSGLQDSREMSDQITAILKDTGHGIVWQPKGLDTAQKLAAREGVASQTLFRDFDSADQTPTVIRRFLDQAAFRAGQQGSVVMVGRVRPDTISALLLWGLQDRASRVAVAPVSAVLRSGLEEQ